MAREEHGLDLTLDPFLIHPYRSLPILTDPYRSGPDCPFVGFTPWFACARR